MIPKPLLPTIGRTLRAAVVPATPVLAQLVVTRRCNLTCGYCNEYDQVSSPVPTDELIRRIDHLAGLGTIIVTLTGGEPLLHPELDVLASAVVARGMVCTSITNGYPLTRSWIERLNRARITMLQMSIDNVEPNELSEKSWSKLRPKLRLLRDHARFDININAVLGSCTREQTQLVEREVKELGFHMTLGLMHDEDGQVDPGLLGDDLADFYDELYTHRGTKLLNRLTGGGWEHEMLRKGTSPWKCRAGARYLYIDENGIVSYCSQRRGTPGIPLLEYGRRELEREFRTRKGCEDACTIACVRRASSYDGWRAQETDVQRPLATASDSISS